MVLKGNTVLKDYGAGSYGKDRQAYHGRSMQLNPALAAGLSCACHEGTAVLDGLM